MLDLPCMLARFEVEGVPNPTVPEDVERGACPLVLALLAGGAALGCPVPSLRPLFPPIVFFKTTKKLQFVHSCSKCAALKSAGGGGW